MDFGVFSEVGRLRKVLVHRPELSLERLAPDNLEELLFDDMLWVEKAKEEHDTFINLMKDNGVKVYYLQELLKETLADSNKKYSQRARSWLVDRTINAMTVGISVVKPLKNIIMEMESDTLAKYLIGGLTKSEMNAELKDLVLDHESLTTAASGPDGFIIKPLPNTLFTRDSSCWIYNGLVLCPSYYQARRFEAIIVGTIYRNHPTLREEYEKNSWEVWYPEKDPDPSSVYGYKQFEFETASLEGGDVMPIGNGTVLMGMSERTTARIIEIVSHKLFSMRAADRVVVAQMSRERSHMHLDTVFTMLDKNIVTIYPNIFKDMKAYSIFPDQNDRTLKIKKEEDFLMTVEEALNFKKGELIKIETGGDSYSAAREQWDDGNNVLALSPGRVIAYSRNKNTNKKFLKEGIDVLEIDGNELGKGRGGPHCMTCPLLRDGID